MSVKNLCLFSGLLGQDPEMKYLPSGSAMVTFGVASRKSWMGDDGQWKDETTWFDCVAFGKKAERIIARAVKGTQVFVEAEYQRRAVQDEETGTNRYFHNFKVVSIDFGKGAIDAGSGESSSEPVYTDAVDVPF